MNIYSQSQQEQIGESDLSQLSWNKIHKSSGNIQNKSKKINKRQPQEIQKKWFSIRNISSGKLDSIEQNELDLREQINFEFDFLKLEKDLLSHKDEIIIEDKKSRKKYLIVPISLESDIIEKLFQLNQKYIITPENIFTYSAQKQQIDDLAKEIKIVTLSFQLLLFQYYEKTIKNFIEELNNQEIKTIFINLLQALISARENQLILKRITLDSIIYIEDKKSFKLTGFVTSIDGNNQNNLQDLGFCLAQIIQLRNFKNSKKHLELHELLISLKDDPFSNIALQMIQNDKSFEEIIKIIDEIEFK